MLNNHFPRSIIWLYKKEDSANESSTKKSVEFIFSKNTQQTESIKTNLITPKRPPKILFINPRNTILRILVRAFPTSEISTIISKKVKANEAIFK